MYADLFPTHVRAMVLDGAQDPVPGTAERRLTQYAGFEQRRTPEQEEALRGQIYVVAPFMDPGQGKAGARDGCEAWPGTTELSYPYATDIQGLPNTLTISITGDPTNPYASGLSFGQDPQGVVLSVLGEQHTIAMAGTNTCVNDIVTAYLVELAAPAEGARCTLP